MPRKNYPKSRINPLYVASNISDIASTLDKACRQKRRFPTEKQAIAQAETLELVHQSDLSTYSCTTCQGWHLTSSRPSK